MNNNRVLILDDDKEILAIYREILTPPVAKASHLRSFMLEEENATPGRQPSFEVVTVTQGEDGVEQVRLSLEQDRPFAMAFVDIRMPPGIDGLESARRIRELDDRIYIVIVTAYSDKSVDEIQETIKHDVLLARKPLTRDEILQLARNACNSWEQDDTLRRMQHDLERQVEEHAMARWYMQNLMSSMSVGLLVCTDQGLITSTNPAATRWSGYAEEDLLGMPIGQLFPGDEIDAILSRIVHQGPLRNVQQIIRNRAGEQHLVLVSGSIVEHAQHGRLSPETSSVVLVLHEPSQPDQP